MSAKATTSTTPTYDALAPAQRAWVDAYLAAGMNQTAASRRLDPKRTRTAAEKHGNRMSGNVGVQMAIRERIAALRIEANEVLYRVDQRARSSADDFLTFETVQKQGKRWVPIGVAIEEKRAEVDVERETNARLELGGDEGAEADEALAKLERELVRLEVWQERDPNRLVQIDGPVTEAEVFRFDLARMRDDGKLHLVKSVTETKEGVKVELHSAEHADDLLAKHTALVGPRGTKEDPLHHKVAAVTEIVFNTPEAGAAGDPDAD